MIAYISMSSEPVLEQVYVKVIRPVLEFHGFTCRHDAVRSIIIGETLENIDAADLVVCDLTNASSGTYYDLGVAHAFRKRTIILSQATAEIPFDTRYQRAIAYTVDRFSLLELRENLFSALRAIYPGGVTPTFADADLTSPDPLTVTELDSARVAIGHANIDARRYALRVLGDNRDKDSYQRIQRILNPDTPAEVVRDALTAFHKIDPERAKQDLVGKYGLWHPNALVRERAVLLIGEYPKTTPWVKRLLDQITDTSWGVRVAVCQVLGRWAAADAETTLYSLRKLDPEPPVQLAAEEALAAIRRPARPQAERVR